MDIDFVTVCPSSKLLGILPCNNSISNLPSSQDDNDIQVNGNGDGDSPQIKISSVDDDDTDG